MTLPLAVTQTAQLSGSSSLPDKFQPAFRYGAVPAKTDVLVRELTTANCASDKQLLPVSAPPAQRSTAGLNVQAAGFETTPSTMPSLASQVLRTALASVATLAALTWPPGAAAALATRLNAPIKPAQL